jgi:hypothetical protein
MHRGLWTLGATMKFAKELVSLALLLARLSNSALAQKMPKPHPDSVSVAVTSALSEGALHWAITNHNDVAVFVYDFFLWGPALSVDHSPEKTTFQHYTSCRTAILSSEPRRACALACFPPGRTITSELQDDRLGQLAGKAVSLTIAVGSDPYTNAASRAATI